MGVCIWAMALLVALNVIVVVIVISAYLRCVHEDNVRKKSRESLRRLIVSGLKSRTIKRRLGSREKQ